MEKEITERIAELFKAFGDPTRVQILSRSGASVILRKLSSFLKAPFPTNFGS